MTPVPTMSIAADSAPGERTVAQGPAARTGSPGPPDAPYSVTIGASTTLGRYELMAVIGTGGMGVVYKARDRELGRIVALKTIRAEFLGSGETVQRFLSEARAVAQLDHAEIVRIFEVGADHGVHFFAMSYVAGESLAARLDRKSVV